MQTRGAVLPRLQARQHCQPKQTPSIAAAVGKIDELLAALRRLEGRVDGITTKIAELKGDSTAGDAMLTDGEDGREGRRKTLRIR